MDRLINFRASSGFLGKLRGVARQRGVPVSQLIRDAVLRDIAAGACAGGR